MLKRSAFATCLHKVLFAQLLQSKSKHICLDFTSNTNGTVIRTAEAKFKSTHDPSMIWQAQYMPPKSRRNASTETTHQVNTVVSAQCRLERRSGWDAELLWTSRASSDPRTKKSQRSSSKPMPETRSRSITERRKFATMQKPLAVLDIKSVESNFKLAQRAPLVDAFCLVKSHLFNESSFDDDSLCDRLLP